MLSGRSGLLKFAAALVCALAAQPLCADDPVGKDLPTGPKTKIEFSRGASTAPALPKPGRNDLQNRFNPGPEEGSSAQADFGPSAPAQAAMPSKAAQERWVEYVDRKRNWLVPGAMDGEGMDVFWKTQHKRQRFFFDGHQALFGDGTLSSRRFKKKKKRHLNCAKKRSGVGIRLMEKTIPTGATRIRATIQTKPTTLSNSI